METTLGCGYLINDESAITDFYSPPSSIADESEDFVYPEEDEDEDDDEDDEIEIIDNNNLSKQIEDDEIKPLPIKLMSPPSTPHIPRRLFDPTIDFQNLKIDTSINTNDDRTPTTNWSLNTPLFPPVINKSSTHLLTPTSMDRYFLEHHRLSDSTFTPTVPNVHQSISVQHTERIQINKSLSETSRLYSYMTPLDGLPSSSSSTFDDTQINNPYVKSPSYLTRQVNPMYSNMNNPWLLSEMSSILRQNNTNNISLSTTAQQILNGNNRPLRSEKIDIEVIKHLIQEANWKRQCGMKKEICVFCRNNGENELIYSSHSLKDSMGNVTCPILRAYQCPICGATGPQAHTIKYCQSTGDDHNRHVPTPYEKMLRMQTFGYDESIPSIFGQFSSPTSLYSNGWSDSYL